MEKKSMSFKRKNGFLDKWLVLLLVLLIYAPVIQIGGVIFKFYQLPMVILFLGWLFNVLRNGALSRHELTLLALYLLAFSYSSIIVMVNGFKDMQILGYMTYGFLITFSAFFIVGLYKANYNDFKNVICRHIFYAGGGHSVFMLLVFFSRDFSEIFYSILSLSEKGLEHLDWGLRTTGLTTSGGAALSVVQASTFLCGLFGFFSASHSKLNNKEMFKLVLGAGLILLSIFISARSGIVVIFVFTFFMFLMYFLGKKYVFAYIKLEIKLLTILGVIAVFLLLIGGYEVFSRNLNWIFEVFNNYSDTGRFYTKSSDSIISRMYFLPNDMQTVIFGNSNLGRGDEFEYLSSDVGYVRLIHAVGIVGTLILFLPNIYILIQGLKLKNGKQGLLLVGLVLIQFTVNFKELFYVLVQGWTFVYFLIVWSVLGVEKK
jgi:hypothetical protein